MLPYAEVRDGLGLHDRLADKGAMLNRVQPMVVCAGQDSNVQEAVDFGFPLLQRIQWPIP